METLVKPILFTPGLDDIKAYDAKKPLLARPMSLEGAGSVEPVRFDNSLVFFAELVNRNLEGGALEKIKGIQEDLSPFFGSRRHAQGSLFMTGETIMGEQGPYGVYGFAGYISDVSEETKNKETIGMMMNGLRTFTGYKASLLDEHCPSLEEAIKAYTIGFNVAQRYHAGVR